MRCILSALLIALTLGQAAAQGQNTPVDVKGLPAQVKALKWKEIDLAALTPLEQCRSLGLMNELLDDISAQMTAEADLMSEFVDTKELGEEFVKHVAVVEDPAVVSVTDGQKFVVALLRGPMAESEYAKQFADYDDTVLSATTKMFMSGCQSKWGVMADNRLRVRSMAQFLKSKGKLDEYKAWAPAAAERAAKQQEAEDAEKRAVTAVEQQQKAEAQKARRAEIQAQQQAARQMQDALAAEQQAQGGGQTGTTTHQSGYVGDGYNNSYYGSSYVAGAGTWYRNGAYLGRAAARTDARYSGWRGGGGRSGGGGGRRR